MEVQEKEFVYLKKDILFQLEAMLMEAVSKGQTLRAKIIFMNMPAKNFQSEMEPAKNIINYSHCANKLFCEAVKRGGVSYYEAELMYETIKVYIEHFGRSEDVSELWMDMIEKYCDLINNYVTKEYSPIIQRAIIWIKHDITMDLSLKKIAEYLNINASYLSNLFHKETGIRVTNFVNEEKMEHAVFLLLNTELHISKIAQECGILDENYFSRIFKKQYQMTPTQYRKQK